eukprot:4838025-Amphidinium_carterae.1
MAGGCATCSSVALDVLSLQVLRLLVVLLVLLFGVLLLVVERFVPADVVDLVFLLLVVLDLRVFQVCPDTAV